ncbi:MAG: hypothetical protein ACK5LJ_11660 [Paracoccus sp. (in: a-proteobacteria)]
MSEADTAMAASPLIDSASNHKDIRDFQVFGERCSGTNYLEHLISENFEATCIHHYGWKHAAPTMPAIWSHSLILVIVRHPLEWLLSLHRTPYEGAPQLHDRAFSDFIREEWESIARPRFQGWEKWGLRKDGRMRGEVLQLDRHPISGRRFANALEMRMIKAQAMMGLRNRAGNFALMRFEDLQRNPASLLTRLGARFNLTAKPAAPKLPTERLDPKSARLRPRLSARDIVPKDLAFIRTGLDPDLESLLGYDIDRLTDAATPGRS